jgi:hypothetical protein
MNVGREKAPEIVFFHPVEQALAVESKVALLPLTHQHSFTLLQQPALAVWSPSDFAHVPGQLLPDLRAILHRLRTRNLFRNPAVGWCRASNVHGKVSAKIPGLVQGKSIIRGGGLKISSRNYIASHRKMAEPIGENGGTVYLWYCTHSSPHRFATRRSADPYPPLRIDSRLWARHSEKLIPHLLGISVDVPLCALAALAGDAELPSPSP